MLSNNVEIKANLLQLAKELLEREQDVYAQSFLRVEQKIYDHIDSLKGIWITPENADYQKLMNLISALVEYKPKSISASDIIETAEKLYEFVSK